MTNKQFVLDDDMFRITPSDPPIIPEPSVKRHYGPGPHPSGSDQDVHAGNRQADIRVIVSADVAEPGMTAGDLALEDIKQPSGAPIRGEEVITWDDSRIPENVYHMTTNMKGIHDSGEISARGKGGLGGDPDDEIVSMTVSQDVAEQLVHDMRVVVEVAKEFGVNEPTFEGEFGSRYRADPETGEPVDARPWSQGLIDRLNELDDTAPDWTFRSAADMQLRDYGFRDWISHYFIHRESAMNIRNPIIYTDAETLAKIDSENIGYVSIPKENLNTGALLMNVDLSMETGLKEIRLHGDVPLDGAEFIDN